MISAIDHGCRIVAVRYPIVLAVILTATPVLAQSTGSDAASGLAGLMGIGFIVALVYSIALFCLPFIVWKCLRRLTDIRDDIRGLRKELAEVSTRVSSVPSSTGTTGKAPEIGNQRLRNLAALVEKNEKDAEQEWQRAREDFTLPPT
jgi:hypothetical protein